MEELAAQEPEAAHRIQNRNHEKIEGQFGRRRRPSVAGGFAETASMFREFNPGVTAEQRAHDRLARGDAGPEPRFSPVLPAFGEDVDDFGASKPTELYSWRTGWLRWVGGAEGASSWAGRLTCPRNNGCATGDAHGGTPPQPRDQRAVVGGLVPAWRVPERFGRDPCCLHRSLARSRVRGHSISILGQVRKILRTIRRNFLLYPGGASRLKPHDQENESRKRYNQPAGHG